MEHLEIILKDIKLEQLEKVFYEHIIFDKSDIISSHFFVQGKDVEYQNIKSLKEYFKIPGTCNIYLKKAKIGIVLKNVLIIIACDGNCADVTINVSREDFKLYHNQKSELQLLLKLLVEISEDNEAKKIVLGYEPAEDEDMKILEVNGGLVKLFQENIGRF